MALESVRLPAPRIQAPPSLAAICAEDAHARACHALGKSYTDVVRGFRGRFEHPPDLVAYPREEADVERVLEWCADERVAAIPFGGGTSVVGGVTPSVSSDYNGVVSIDLGALERVLEVDDVSRAACIQAGALGPRLESQLGEHGFTLRHFPQSFEYSTLGGWIATRAAGHFATLWTHIEDFVESVRAITPAGAWESRRLPGSGAGVSPDRMLAGSEGTLGVITQAWVRVQPRPTHRDSAGVRFASFLAGAECVRAISQSGLHPSNCRLLDAGEAALTMAGDGSHALLVLGFESADHPVAEAMARALELCAAHGGTVSERRDAAGGDAVSSLARRVPRRSVRARRARGDGRAGGDVRDGDHVGALRGLPRARDRRDRAGGARGVRRRAAGSSAASRTSTPTGPRRTSPCSRPRAAARRSSSGPRSSRRPPRRSSPRAATITHHHAVGRDHRPWYDRQRPEPFAAALRGAKLAVDPAGVMNPGVLIDPIA